MILGDRSEIYPKINQNSDYVFISYLTCVIKNDSTKMLDNNNLADCIRERSKVIVLFTESV